MATKTAHVQMDNDLPIGYWQVRDAACVAAVECFRPDATGRTGCACGRRADEQMHHLTAELYVLENEPGAGRQQLLRTHRPPFGWPGDPPGRGGLPETGDDLQGGCQDLAQNNQRQPARNVCQSQVATAADNTQGDDGRRSLFLRIHASPNSTATGGLMVVVTAWPNGRVNDSFRLPRSTR